MTGKPKERSRRPRSLAELAPGCLDDALKAQGFASTEIVTRWSEIVGPELAAYSEPVKMLWPPRGPASDPGSPRPAATLLVRVEGAFAMELQHMAAVVVERVNRYFGWACVGGLRFRQGPVRRATARKAPPPPPDPETRARIRELVSGVEEPKLADALTRLGEAVSVASKRRPITRT